MNYNEFLKKYQKKEVVELPNLVKSRPVVSVVVMAYNHGFFIERCLSEILRQQTNFAFEIILGEDESSDDTLVRCKKISSEHPDKIRLFLHSRENNLLINGKHTGRFNFIYSLYSSRGKYISICDGDDYWTDPLKLQKQVDFLEANEGYVACFHKANVLDQLGQYKNQREYIVSRSNQTYTTSKLIERHVIPTASLVFRNQIDNFSHLLIENKKILQLDVFFELLLSTRGNFYFFDEYMSIYRIHDKGISRSKRNMKNGLNSYLNLLEEFDKLTDGRYAQHINLKKQSLLREHINQNNTFQNRCNTWLIHRKMKKEISLKEERELIYTYLIPRLYKYLKGY